MRNSSQTEGKIKVILATPWRDGLSRYYKKCVLITAESDWASGLENGSRNGTPPKLST